MQLKFGQRFGSWRVVGPAKDGRLRHFDARVLDLIMSLANRGEIVTSSKIAKALRWRSNYSVTLIVRKLRSMGLVTFDERGSRIAYGTIRPACRFIPVEDLK